MIAVRGRKTCCLGCRTSSYKEPLNDRHVQERALQLSLYMLHAEVCNQVAICHALKSAIMSQLRPFAMSLTIAFFFIYLVVIFL